MLPRELMQKVRKIELRTTHIVEDLLSGQYHSAFKGRGIEFEEVRPYYPGDDVRAIDWKVTARSGEPFVKLFREERELTVHLLVDISGSQSFGTQSRRKRELISELGALLGLAAIRNNDKVGLTLFTERIEMAIPPKKGRRHGLRVIRELVNYEPLGRGTDVAAAVQHLNKVAKRRSVVFLVSDFMDRSFEQALEIARRKHDVIPIVVGDERESILPDVGLIDVIDPETGEIRTLDTTSRALRRRYAAVAEARHQRLDQLFRKLSLDSVYLHTGEELVEPLRRFFQRREHRMRRL